MPLTLTMLLILIWIGMLITGYGVLAGSRQNVAGMNLQRQYPTPRSRVKTQYIYSDSSVIGVAGCPLLRKSASVIDSDEVS